MIDFGYGAALDTIEKARDKARDWRNDPSIYYVCRQVGLIDEKSQAKWFDAVQGNPSMQMFAIVVKDKFTDDGVEEDYWKCVGVCGLTSISMVHRSAELSYYVAPEYHNCPDLPPRFGLCVFKTLIRYAFDDMGLNRVFGDSFADNFVAISNLNDLGFKKEGVLRQSYYKKGKYIDSVIQSLLRREYEEVKNAW